MADGREGEGLDVGREGDEGAVLGRGAGGQRRSVEPDDRVGRVVGAAGVAVCEVEEVDEVVGLATFIKFAHGAAINWYI